MMFLDLAISVLPATTLGVVETGKKETHDYLNGCQKSIWSNFLGGCGTISESLLE